MSVLPKTYIEGQRVRLAIELKEKNLFVDPPALVFKYLKPDAASVVALQYGVNAEVVRDDIGKYHVDVDTTNAPGMWRYRVESLGTFQGAEQFKFRVKAASPS